jgi:hypothetical protein
MKIRNGFVSNSSSSSFLIYGAELSEHKEELCKKFGLEEGVNLYELREVIEEKTRLSVDTVMGESLYVGRSWCSVKDDETGLQFKQSVEKIFKEELGLDVKCDTHSEAWYNG